MAFATSDGCTVQLFPKDLSLSAGLLPAPCACADDRAVAAPSFRTRHGYKYEPEL